jgi:hypothetical protein
MRRVLSEFSGKTSDARLLTGEIRRKTFDAWLPTGELRSSAGCRRGPVLLMRGPNAQRPWVAPCRERAACRGRQVLRRGTNATRTSNGHASAGTRGISPRRAGM